MFKLLQYQLPEKNIFFVFWCCWKNSSLQCRNARWEKQHKPLKNREFKKRWLYICMFESKVKFWFSSFTIEHSKLVFGVWSSTIEFYLIDLIFVNVHIRNICSSKNRQ